MDLKEKIADLQRKIISDDPREFLLNDEERTAFQWLKTLPDDEEGLKLLYYAAFTTDKITIDFLKRCGTKHSPFFLPVVLHLLEARLAIEKTELEETVYKLTVQKENAKNRLESLRKEITSESDKIRPLKDEIAKLETVRDKLRTEIENFPEEQQKHFERLQKLAVDREKEFRHKLELLASNPKNSYDLLKVCALDET